jgi:hypothetical protein
VRADRINRILICHPKLVDYLTATGKDIGLLLNFGARSLEFKRKFRVYRETSSEPFMFRENPVNPVNSF